jgi:hypothetical protein
VERRFSNPFPNHQFGNFLTLFQNTDFVTFILVDFRILLGFHGEGTLLSGKQGLVMAGRRSSAEAPTSRS